MRDFAISQEKDTGDSASDFLFVSTLGASVAGTVGPLTPQLGSPSPEGLGSPAYANHLVGTTLIDPSVASGVAPNRVRVTGGGSLGALILRRTIKNNSGRALTRVRFGVTSITALAPNLPVAQADVRLVSSEPETVTLANGTTTVAVSGTTVEAGGAGQPAQPLGGGTASSLNYGEVNLGTPLLPGEVRSYNFKLLIERGGSYFVALNILALPNAPSGVDAAVRVGEGVSVGEDASSTDGVGQGVSLTVNAETSATYYVKVRNRDSAPQALVLRGTAGGNGWDVNYWDDRSEEDSYATDRITSPEGFTTPVLSNAPQDFFELRVTITPHSGVTPGARLPVLISLTSTLDPSQRDTVSIETTRRVPPPDLAIRTLKQNDLGLLGLGQQDVSGEAQTEAGLTIPGAALIYIVKVRNYSGFTQNLLLSAPADAGGWTTRVYDGLRADTTKEITTTVLQSGWPLELASGAEREVRVEVTPGQSGVFNRLVPLTVALANDAGNKDVARIEAAMQKLSGIEVSIDQGKTWTDAPAPENGGVLSVPQYSVIGLRAKRGNSDVPWPNGPFKPEWQRGSVSLFGAQVWLHFSTITPNAEAGEEVRAECGNNLSFRIKVTPKA